MQCCVFAADLLAPDDERAPPLFIVEDLDRGAPRVKGLTEVIVSSLDEVIKLAVKGMRHHPPAPAPHPSTQTSPRDAMEGGEVPPPPSLSGRPVYAQPLSP